MQRSPLLATCLPYMENSRKTGQAFLLLLCSPGQQLHGENDSVQKLQKVLETDSLLDRWTINAICVLGKQSQIPLNQWPLLGKAMAAEQATDTLGQITAPRDPGKLAPFGALSGMSGSQQPGAKAALCGVSECQSRGHFSRTGRERGKLTQQVAGLQLHVSWASTGCRP
jgi:hypothetical protein